MAISFTNAPFEIMLDDYAKTISRTPITKTTSNLSGDETLTEGTPANISGAFFRKRDGYHPEKWGLLQSADAVLIVKDSVTVNKDDKLTYDGESYRADDIITRRMGTVVFYHAIACFLI